MGDLEGRGEGLYTLRPVHFVCVCLHVYCFQNKQDQNTAVVFLSAKERTLLAEGGRSQTSCADHVVETSRDYQFG